MNHIKRQSDIQITVVIPAYNVEGYIQRAIDSILAQTRLPDEIIVVDDGSRDATAENIKSYGDKVRYIYQDNKGLSGARNTGIREAAYDWIAFLDADDEWLPKHLELQTALLSRNPQLAWSGANYICCLCKEKQQGANQNAETIRALMKGKDFFENFFEAHVRRSIGNVNGMMIHKKVFQTVGLFNEKQAFAEDIEMWWRIAYAFPRFGFVAEATSIYHLQRPGTLTEEFNENKLGWLTDLLRKNIALSIEYDMEKAFSGVVRFLVISWTRGLLFENKPEQVRRLLEQFGAYLSFPFKFLIHILMIRPAATARLCHRISRVVRKFRLRRKLIRPPSAAASGIR